MRLRNIPGAKDAITGSNYVVQEPASHKGKWAGATDKERTLGGGFCEKAAASYRSRNGKRTLFDGLGASSSGDQLCRDRDV